MNSLYHYDLLTIGAGSGGVAASRRAASHGARVAICERDRVGGTCVIRGCVPKKILMYASEFSDTVQDSVGYGWHMDARFDWATLHSAQSVEVARLEQVYEGMLRDAGVALLRGEAQLVDAHTVRIGDRAVTAEHLLIATGGSPVLPQVSGASLFQTSNDVFGWKSLPMEIVIVGGGYIAVEFAGIFHGLGARTTLLVRGPVLLGGFDAGIQASLLEQLTARGVNVLLRHPLDSISRQDDGFTVASGDMRLRCGAVLAATGRAANTRGLGLERLGIALGPKGEIQVNAHCATSVANVHAVGDVTDLVNLTPVAIAQGRSLADSLFGGQEFWYSPEDVPSAVFSQPPVACVGVTEEETRRSGTAVDIYESKFRPLKNTVSGRTERTFIKLIVDRDTQRVLGCHMVGRDAPEIMQGLAIAVKCGARKADLDRTVGIHPTAAEEWVTLRTPRLS